MECRIFSPRRKEVIIVDISDDEEPIIPEEPMPQQFEEETENNNSSPNNYSQQESESPDVDEQENTQDESYYTNSNNMNSSNVSYRQTLGQIFEHKVRRSGLMFKVEWKDFECLGKNWESYETVAEHEKVLAKYLIWLKSNKPKSFGCLVKKHTCRNL